MSSTGVTGIILTWVIAYRRQKYEVLEDEEEIIEFSFDEKDIQLEVIRRVGHPF